MKTRIAVVVAAVLLGTAGLVACNNDQACAKPGGGSGSSGSRSSGGSSSYRSNSGVQKAPAQQRPATKTTTKSKPKVHIDDDLFEGDDNGGENCDD